MKIFKISVKSCIQACQPTDPALDCAATHGETCIETIGIQIHYPVGPATIHSLAGSALGQRRGSRRRRAWPRRPTLCPRPRHSHNANRERQPRTLRRRTRRMRRVSGFAMRKPKLSGKRGDLRLARLRHRPSTTPSSHSSAPAAPRLRTCLRSTARRRTYTGSATSRCSMYRLYIPLSLPQRPASLSRNLG